MAYKAQHPGKHLKHLVLTPRALGINKAASDLQVSPSTLSRLVEGKSDMTAAMAVRLERATANEYTADQWMEWQAQYDIEKARETMSAEIEQVISWKTEA